MEKVFEGQYTRKFELGDSEDSSYVEVSGSYNYSHFYEAVQDKYSITQQDSLVFDLDEESFTVHDFINCFYIIPKKEIPIIEAFLVSHPELEGLLIQAYNYLINAFGYQEERFVLSLYSDPELDNERLFLAIETKKEVSDMLSKYKTFYKAFGYKMKKQSKRKLFSDVEFIE